jgi:hypothetical protein
MKASLSLIILFCLGLSYSYRPTKKEITIQKIKEHPEIDTLLKIALDEYMAPGKRTSEEASKDSCLLLYVLTTRDDFLFSVETNDKYNINLCVNWSIRLKRNVGYFKYKKMNVFVCPDNAFSKFFSKTENRTSFSFITKLDTNEMMYSKLAFLGYSNSYTRKNGSFVLDNPPMVR